MTTFTDDFNRADGAPGAGWVEVSGDWSIVSNQLSPGTIDGTVVLRAATAMSSSDNSSQVTVAATTSASQGVWCRGNSDLTSGYLWRNNGSNWALFSVVGETFTSIGTFAAAAAPGDVAKVQAVGSTIKGFVNGVERVSVVDTAVTTGTSVGIRSEANTSLRYDDFTGSDTASTVIGTAVASYGGLTATATGVRTTHGTGGASYGGLVATASGSVQVVAPVGSWHTLQGFLQEAREIEHKDATEAPVECPYCYTALREAPGNVLYCPWLPHYEYPRDGKLVQ